MSYWNLHFIQWFKSFPHWNVIGWLSIIGVGAYWEIMGAIYKDRTTFTDLVRHSVPVDLRLAVLLVLLWHFGCYARIWQYAQWSVRILCQIARGWLRLPAA